MNTIRTRLPDVIDQAGIGIAQINLDGLIDDVNTAFAAMLGRTPESLVGAHWRETIHRSDHPKAWAVHAGAHLGKPGYFECRGLRADGGTIDQAVSVVGVRKSETEKIDGYFCVRQNISAHRMAQTQFELAVDLAPVGVLIVDREGTILMANSAIERLFRYDREELISAKVEMLLPSALAKAHLEHRERFNQASYVTAMAGRDLVGRRSDGAEIPVQVYLNVLETSTSTALLCTVIDIEPRLRYEEQLEKAREAAELANRAKSDFLARMSHEIRTPMNLIMGMNSLLLETDLTPTQKKYAEISYRNVQRLVRLTNGILDLSKVEAGMLTLDSHLFEVRTVVAEALATILTAAERKGLLLSADVDDSVSRWWIGDPERIVQILLNLVGNSIKFTTDGGVKVTVTETDGSGPKGLCFYIDDTGCGVTDEQAEVIFEAFQQADTSLHRQFEGTGLGLTICRSLAKLMGGDIEIVKKTTPGMLVKVTIFPTPAEAPQFETNPLSGNRKMLPGEFPTGLRILLAEDNPENAYLVRAYLEGLSVRLEFAEDGGEAVAKARATHYDLILMDIQMPVLDGYAATRMIRGFDPHVPIIALTAHALIHASGEAMRAGCNGYVAKPVERDELLQTILQLARPAPAPVKKGFYPESESARTSFLQNRKRDMQRIADARAQGDLDAVRRIGHNIKGCAKGYGFPEIGVAASAIEDAIRENELAALERSIEQFTHAVEEACQLAHVS